MTTPDPKAIIKAAKPSKEQRYFDALRHIARSDSTDFLVRMSQKRYGLTYNEALEYAYENIQQVAKSAIAGRRRPER